MIESIGIMKEWRSNNIFWKNPIAEVLFGGENVHTIIALDRMKNKMLQRKRDLAIVILKMV